MITNTPEALTSAVDAGAMPGSQRLSLTVTLAQSDAQRAALDQFLSDVVTARSATFHKFLAPAEFAASYGAAQDQIAAATAWATAQGLSVDAISPSATRLTLSGPASAVQSAFAVTLHNYLLSGKLYFANATQPSLPTEAAALITAIDGLSSLPAASLKAQGSATTFAALASTIDANTTPILTLESSLSSTSLTESQIAAYSLLLRQASAQGITLLASRPALGGAFPAAIPEVTAVAAPGATADPSAPTLARPSWQFAPGLPADSLRYTPDLTAASLSAFAQTLSEVETAGVTPAGRQGNINRILYELSPTAGLYTQPDSAAAGTWEHATGLGLIDLKVLAKVFPRGTTAVEVDTTSSNYSPVHGQGFTLTTTVYPGAATAPTGTITWTSSQAGFISQSATLNGSGVATSPTFQLPGGSFSITSSYSGDATYAADGTSTTVFVSSEAANFTIAAPATATLGGTAAITASVSSPSGVGVPTGTVTTSFTGSADQTATLTPSSGSAATASFSFNVAQAGTVAISASCTSGDQSFTCFNNQTASLTVAKATPTVSLALSTATPAAGTAITFTASVAGIPSVSPTGTINILDNGATIATITLPATTASAPLSTGATHSITAQYSGDTNYNTATSAATSATGGLASTTTTVTAFPTSFPYGQTTTLVIAVAPTSGTQINGTAPSGSVSVTAGTQAAVTQTLNNGNGNVTLTGLTPGTYPIKVTYSGDTNYAASTNTAASITVTPFAATIVPMLSYNMFTQGSTQTLTVQFSSPTNGPVPQNAAFTATLAGVTYPGTFSINGGGVNATGMVTINAPVAGTYMLQVACVANADFTCNTPAPITVTSTATSTSNPPPTTGTGTSPTKTVLTSSSASPGAGAAITLTATVTSTASPALTTAPTGTVSFYDGTTLLTTAPVALSGSAYLATASVTLTGTAAHSLTAVYSGDTTFATSTSAAVSVSSTASASAITLTASTTTGPAGQSVTFTAKVTGSTFSGVVPTGSVTFFLGGVTPAALGTEPLNVSGPGVSVATFTTTGIPAGAQTIYAVYSGDGNFAAITSATITLGFSDYTVAFTPGTLALSAGQSGSTTAAVTLVGGYAGTISLACTPPINTLITCSFSPSTLTGGGASTLTVTTVSGKAVSAANHRGSFQTQAAAAFSLAALLSLLLPGRTRRRLVPSLLLILFALVLTANLGCSGTQYSTPIAGAGTGTPLGTAILTINTAGSDGTTTIHHDYSLQVTVQ